MKRPREVAVPPALSAALEQLLGESVAGVRVIERSWFVRLHGPAIATTRRERIYLRGTAANFFASPWLVLHEYWHVVGQWRRGRLTVPRYLLECARRGYWNNRFEVEARACADRHAASLARLLALPPGADLQYAPRSRGLRAMGKRPSQTP
jgi:hypothetical protein